MKKTIYLSLMVLMLSCSGSKIITLATHGELSKKEFNIDMPFYYYGKYMYIDIVIQQKTYTFLFDTGWDITHIDKSLLAEIDFSPVKKYKTTGSSFEDGKVLYGFLSSLAIDDVEFKKIGVGVRDLSFVKSTFPDNRKIYGIIGANMLRKAFWQIDYQNQRLKFSNKIENFPPSTDAHQIPMIPKDEHGWGYCRLQLQMNGVTDYFVFDTGSYGSFTANHAYLKSLKIGAIPIVEVSTIREKIADKRKYKVSDIKMHTLEFKDSQLLIEKEVKLLIGNGFLENYIVTIDWSGNKLYLQPLL